MRGEEGRGGLLADAGDAGQSVGGVAAQHRIVGVLRGQHTILLDDGGFVEHLEVAHAAAGVDDADAVGVVDQLEEVAVTGDDVDGHRRLRGEARDDVVGLVRRNSGDGDAEGIECGADDGDLRLEGVRHLFHIGGGLDEFGDAVRLVAGDEVDAPLRAPVVVPAGDEVGRLVRHHELRDHVEQSARGVDGTAVGRLHGVGHAVERAEVEAGGVEQHEAVGHAIILTRGRCAWRVSSRCRWGFRGRSCRRGRCAPRRSGRRRRWWGSRGCRGR